MAGGTELPKDGFAGRSTGRLRLEQWAHRGEDPQCLHIKGVARTLRDAVVVDRRVNRRRVPLHKTCRRPARVELVAGETASSLVDTGVGVEVGVAAAHGTPIQQFL